MHQPDAYQETDQEPLTKQEDESEEEFQARFLSQRVYRGRLEAIKLTGDANVPRGEYTFIADDLGEQGFIGIAQTPPFHGARIVASRGHVADIGFRYGEIDFSPKRNWCWRAAQTNISRPNSSSSHITDWLSIGSSLDILVTSKGLTSINSLSPHSS